MHLRQSLSKPLARLYARRARNQYDDQLDRFNELRQDDRYAIVIFDALRFDVAAEIVPLYLRGEGQCVWSAAHDTFQYGQRVWGDRVWGDVTYVSGAVPINSDRRDIDNDHFNDYYGDFVPAEHLPRLVDAWRDAWDTSIGTTQPEAVTEIAEEYVSRDQLVVHYFQPHGPYIGRRSLLGHTDGRNAEPITGQPVDEPIYQRVRSGEVSGQELRRVYYSNTIRTLEAALPLLRELAQDRRVVLTADHGELLTDYGRSWLYGHPRIPYPPVRRVPWIEVDGVREYPDQPSSNGASGSIEEKLEALGYR